MSTPASDRLRITVVAMSDVEQRALASALDHQSGTHTEPRMRAFYAALCTLVEEAAAVAGVRDRSLPMVLDLFDSDENI